MKYMEYIWLASSVFFVAILVIQYEHLKPINFAILIGGIFVSAFMFSFRRRMRIKQEQVREEEIRRLEKELEDDESNEYEAENSVNPTHP